MKRIATYKVNMESTWITASAMLMGLAFFVRAVYFLAMGGTDAGAANVVFLMVLPMILEAGWFVLLKGVKLNAAGIYGILAMVTCVLLAVQNFFGGNVLQMVLGVIAYLLVSGLMFLVVGGYFPYKYFCLAALGVILLVRFLGFDLGYLRSGNWQGFLVELPALCNLAALALFFGGIGGRRIET